MTDSWAPAPTVDVVWVELDGEVVVYHESQHVAHLLNETGGLLWQLFDGTATIDELAADVSAVFEVSQESAREQVLDFAMQMKALGLVVAARGDAEETE